MPEPRNTEENLLLRTAITKLDELSNAVDELRHDIRGNGEKGLKQRMARAESHLYKNPHTGDPGIIQKTNDHEKLIGGVRAQMRMLNWFLGIFGTGSILWVVQNILGFTR